MTGKVPTFLFHIPKCDGMLNYDELADVMGKRNAPKIVHVIDTSSRKRLGAVPSSVALLKFK